MKRSKLTENNFETSHVIKTLVGNDYIERLPDNYNQELFLDSEVLLNFVKSTQPEEWEKLKEQYPGNTEEIFLKHVSSEIGKRGTLDVLRNGVKDRGTKFELAYFKPVSGLNPEHEKLYKQNRFSVIRQLPFSQKYQKTLDISIFLNGIPIITAELKNHFTGQDYTDAVKQYKFDRDPKEPFLRHCLVHFALDNDKAYFTTRLEGEATQFLPFNKDIENPEDKRGFRVAYLYHDIWHPDSLLEIIYQYIQIAEKEELKTGKKTKKIIFPRFHQLTAVKQIVDSTRKSGAGKNYLIQHSAGSGKTFTISRLHAVRYKLEFDRQLKEQGSNAKALVAFTGTIKDEGHEFTESNMNGFPESQTVKKFDTDEYRIMIVAHKFQTGFDQPLLHTMYVDKKLKGVNAVQTLSRLNRIFPGKDSVSVLDFVNETDEIRKAFQPYYETTILSEGTDPNVLYQIERDIYKFDVIDTSDVERFAEVWYSTEDQSKLHQILAPAIVRFKELINEDKHIFKDNLRRYVKIYAFISQIVSFQDVSLEKFYLYCRFLIKKLPLDKDSLPREVVESVDMDRYRIKQTYKGGITLEKKEGELAPLMTKEKKPPVSEFDRLSAIIEKINEIGGTQFTEDDKVKFTKLADTISSNENFRESIRTNTKSNLKLLFKKLFDEAIADMYESDLSFYKKIEENPSSKDLIKENLFEDVFRKGRELNLYKT